MFRVRLTICVFSTYATRCAYPLFAACQDNKHTNTYTQAEKLATLALGIHSPTNTASQHCRYIIFHAKIISIRGSCCAFFFSFFLFCCGIANMSRHNSIKRGK